MRYDLVVYKIDENWGKNSFMFSCVFKLIKKITYLKLIMSNSNNQIFFFFFYKNSLCFGVFPFSSPKKSYSFMEDCGFLNFKIMIAIILFIFSNYFNFEI